MKRPWSDFSIAPNPPIPIVAVLGPTAGGKSGLAEFLAKALNGELINCDASAVYRELSIGVTKPCSQAREAFVYHCLDLANLSEGFDLKSYLERAEEAIDDITSRGRLPIVVGGSSLYSRALLQGYRPPEVDVSEETRARVRSLPLSDALRELQELDPSSFERIDRQNPRRVFRALELAASLGGPCPEPSYLINEAWLVHRVVLDVDRDVLKRRIQERTEEMWASWLEEVDLLEKNGLLHWLELRKPIGYGIVCSFLKGELSEELAKSAIVKQTVSLAKKQKTWLNKEKESQYCLRYPLKSESDWDDMPEQVLVWLRQSLREEKRIEKWP